MYAIPRDFHQRVFPEHLVWARSCSTHEDTAVNNTHPGLRLSSPITQAWHMWGLIATCAGPEACWRRLDFRLWAQTQRISRQDEIQSLEFGKTQEALGDFQASCFLSP